MPADSGNDSGPRTVGVAELPWRSIALFLVTAATLICSALFTQVLLFSIVGAVALAICTQPLTLWLERRLSPTFTATILVVLATLALVLPLVYIARDLLGEVLGGIRFVQSGAAEDLIRRMAQNHPKIGGTVRQIAQQTDLTSTLRRLAGSAAGPLASGLGKLASGITSGVMLLFFYFFLVRDHRAARAALAALIPLHSADTDDLLRQTGDVVQAIFAGRFVIALIQAVLAGIAYLLLGIPGALLWSAITFVCCLIPAFGSFVAWLPLALYLGLAQSWTKAAILAAWGGIVVGNIDNVLYPALVGDRTNLHTALIFVALFGGIAVFGLSGFILGPVIVAVAMFLLRIWKRRFAGSAVDLAA